MEIELELSLLCWQVQTRSLRNLITLHLWVSCCIQCHRYSGTNTYGAQEDAAVCTNTQLKGLEDKASLWYLHPPSTRDLAAHRGNQPSRTSTVLSKGCPHLHTSCMFAHILKAKERGKKQNIFEVGSVRTRFCYNTSTLTQTIYQVTHASLGGGIGVSKSFGEDFSPTLLPLFLLTEYRVPTDGIQTAH